MTFNQVVAHFGSQVAAARALKITKGALQFWRRDGVPPLRQLQLEELTKGRLRADKDVLIPRKRAA